MSSKGSAHLTHVFHIFLTDFDERRDLCCILDLVWRRRERGRQYDVVPGAERFVPESTPLNVTWTPTLNLPAEVIPKPPVPKLRVGEDTKDPDCYKSKGSHRLRWKQETRERERTLEFTLTISRVRVPEIGRAVYLILRRIVSGALNSGDSFTYYESGIPCHLCLEYGQFCFGTRERLMIVPGKVSLGQLPGRN